MEQCSFRMEKVADDTTVTKQSTAGCNAKESDTIISISLIETPSA